MLINIFNSDEFKESLESMTTSEIERLLDLCIINKPLYSQPEYFLSLIRELSTNIIKAKDSNVKANEDKNLMLLAPAKLILQS